jgi:hypothetical protein
MARRKKELSMAAMATGLKKAGVRSGKNVAGKRAMYAAKIAGKNPLSTTKNMLGPKGRGKFDSALRGNVKRELKGTIDKRLSKAKGYLEKRAARTGGSVGLGTKAKLAGKMAMSKLQKWDQKSGKQVFKRRYKLAAGAALGIAAIRAMRKKKEENQRRYK